MTNVTKVPSVPTADSPGVRVDSDGVNVSQQSVDGIVDAFHRHWSELLQTVERMWARSLDWAQNNPVLFALALLLVAFWIYQKRCSRVEIAQMTLQYEGARTGGRRRRARGHTAEEASSATPQEGATQEDSGTKQPEEGRV